MNLKNVFGGVLANLDPIELVKDLATKAGAQFSKPIITDFLTNRLSAEGRVKLGKQLAKAGRKLQADDVEAAADVLSDVIEGVEF